MDTEISYDKYRMLLAEKKSLFTDYNETTLCLKHSLTEHNDSQSAACLERRHQIINRIAGINRSMGTETANLKKNAEMFRKADIIGMQKDIMMLMGNSSGIEQECMHMVTTERNAIKNEILGHRQNHHRNIGYQSSGSDSAKYIDTKIL